MTAEARQGGHAGELGVDLSQKLQALGQDLCAGIQRQAGNVPAGALRGGAIFAL